MSGAAMMPMGAAGNGRRSSSDLRSGVSGDALSGPQGADLVRRFDLLDAISRSAAQLAADLLELQACSAGKLYAVRLEQTAAIVETISSNAQGPWWDQAHDQLELGMSYD